MKCILCGSDELKARVTLSYDVPLAQRMGTVKVGGLKVTQLDVKEAWDNSGSRRGPIYCQNCGEEHYYLVGDPSPLRRKDDNEDHLDDQPGV